MSNKGNKKNQQTDQKKDAINTVRSDVQAGCCSRCKINNKCANVCKHNKCSEDC